VSNECKMVVDQYGDQIIELLLEQVYMCWLALGGRSISFQNYTDDGTCMSWWSVGFPPESLF
jgi:hypothetical protein